MTGPPPRLPRGPFVLLALMTATTLGGPLGIGYVLRGGESPSWPPDRPIEWVMFAGTCGAVVALMLACCSLALVNHKAMKGPTPPPVSDPSEIAP